jgi:hypothetical protein
MNILTFCTLTPLNTLSKSKVSIVTSHPISLIKATSTYWPCNSSTKANPQHFNSSYASRLALKLFGFHATSWRCYPIHVSIHSFRLCMLANLAYAFKWGPSSRMFIVSKYHCFYIYSIVTTLIVKSRRLLQNDWLSSFWLTSKLNVSFVTNFDFLLNEIKHNWVHMVNVHGL